MAYSTQRVTSDGTLSTLAISLDYFERDEISVLIGGIANTENWSWVGDTEATIEFTPDVANGVEVTVVRTTAMATPRHQFTLGAAFTANSVDENSNQVLRVVQEARENAGATDIYNNVDVHGYKLKHVGIATEAGDVLVFEQLATHDATIIGYRDQAENYKDAAAASAADAEASAVEAAASAALALHPWETDAGGIKYIGGDVKVTAGDIIATAGKVTVPQNYNVTSAYGALQVAGADVLRFGSDTSGQLAGFRNKIINGDFSVWQRGVSLSSGINAFTYFADRWSVYAQGAAVTCVKSSGIATFRDSAAFQGAAGNTAVAPIHRTESLNCFYPAGTVLTLSGWVYVSSGSITPNWTVDSANAQDVFSGTTYVASGSFGAQPTGWSYVSAQFTTNTACQNGIQVQLALGATGSGVTKAITGLQLEEGSIATPFEHRPYGLELGLCQRYYVTKLAPQGVGVGSSTVTRATCTYPVRMRAAPTITIPNTCNWYNGAVVSQATGAVTSYGNEAVFNCDIITGSTMAAGTALVFLAESGNITASAEL